MQKFFICQNSVLPNLEMEVIKDGRYDYHKSLLNDALQDCVVTFSMVNEATGQLKIGKAKANIVLAKDTGCEEKYILQYKWQPRDTKEIGYFKGWFDIKFNGNLSSSDNDYPNGLFKVPIQEDLQIIIK